MSIALRLTLLLLFLISGPWDVHLIGFAHHTVQKINLEPVLVAATRAWYSSCYEGRAIIIALSHHCVENCVHEKDTLCAPLLRCSGRGCHPLLQKHMPKLSDSIEIQLFALVIFHNHLS